MEICLSIPGDCFSPAFGYNHKLEFPFIHKNCQQGEEQCLKPINAAWATGATDAW